MTAAIASGAMIAQQVAGRATRDALFLSSFEASTVPQVMIASAVMSFVAVLLLSRALLIHSPARVVPITFAASAALLVGEWVLSLHAPAPAALALYLHLAIFGATLISAFWSLINERFDPHTARRFMGRIAGGGTAGGVIGGLFAWRAGRVMGAPSMILVVAAANAIASFQTWRLGLGVTRAPPVSVRGSADVGGRPVSAYLGALRKSSHLRDLALLVGLGAVSGALFDVALSTEAAAAVIARDDLLSFFALFHLSVGLLSFALQALAANAALEQLGLAGTVGLLPAAVLASTLSLAIAPRLWAASIVRATEAVMRNSLFRSGYELLYTPLPAEQKRAMKTLIDVGTDRIGTAVGSGLAMLALALVPRATLPALIGAGAAFAAGTLVLTPRLHRSYVAALEGSLRSGVVSLDPASIIDATTRRTLSGTIDALSRDKILAEIAALRMAAATRAEAERGSHVPAEGERDRPSYSGVPSVRALLDGSGQVPPPAGSRPGDMALSSSVLGSVVSGASGRGSPSTGTSEADPLLAAVAELRSGDAERIRRVLARELDPMLVTHAIPLLAREGLVSDVVRALRAASPRATGQLLDALLDPAVAFAVRHRIPRVLQACPTQRAADGLMLGLADERFEVRYQCGIALARLRQHGAPLLLRREEVIAAAQREIDVERSVWEAEKPGAPRGAGAPSEAPTRERLLSDRTSRSLEHVFRVLSLSLEREPLELAYRALHADDAHLRGTALEYLENVLPESIRAGLWPYVGSRSRPAPAVRPAQHALDELLRSAASIPRGPLAKRLQKDRSA